MRRLQVTLLGLLSMLMSSSIVSVNAQDKESKPCKAIAGNGYFGPTVEAVDLDYLSSIPKITVPFDRWFYIKKIVKSTEKVSAVAVTHPDGSKIYIDLQKRFYTSACFEQKPVEKMEGFDEINILVPPIKPNSSFFLVISYFLNETALDVYFELFEKIHNTDDIGANSIISSLPGKTVPELSVFKNFYETNLKALYDKYTDANQQVKDNLKIKISAIINTKPLEIPIILTDKDERKQKKELEKKGEEVTNDPIKFTRIRFRDIEVTGLAQQTFSLDTRSKYVLLPDVGYIYYGFNDKFRGATPYAGVAINFRSYDPDIPLKLIRNNFVNRLSFHMGVTFGSVAKDLYREDLLGSRTLIAGLGYSFSHALRLNGGLLLYNKLDSNQLIDTRRVNAVPYIGLSLDLKIKELAKDAATIFTGDLLPKVR